MRPRRTDPLLVLAAHRRNLLANKTRDYAAEITERSGHAWPEQSRELLSLSDGKPVAWYCAAEFNARERLRAFPALRRHYYAERERAMAPTLTELSVAETFAAQPRPAGFDNRGYPRYAGGAL